MKVKEENIKAFANAIIQLTQTMKNEAENCIKMCGVFTERELSVLYFVGQNKNVKMSDIADNIDAPMSTLTSIVDKLVEKKLLSRDHSGEDRRVVNVSLTAYGKAAHSKLLEKQKKVAEVVLSKLNEKEQVLITNHLNLIIAQMASLS